MFIAAKKSDNNADTQGYNAQCQLSYTSSHSEQPKKQINKNKTNMNNYIKKKH